MEYKSKTVSVNAKDGTALNVLSVGMDTEEIKAVIIICHGFSEHAALYGEIANDLNNAGFGCLAFDQRGHGKPPVGSKKNWQGIIPSYQSFLDDVQTITAYAKSIAPDAPIVLYGHSMGGCIVLNTLLHMQPEEQAQYVCAIVEAPWLDLHNEMTGFTRGLLKILNKVVPNLRMSRKPKRENLSCDKERASAVADDEFYHGYISFHMLKEITDACDFALANAENLAIPTFLALAEKDLVVSNNAQLLFVQKAKQNAKLKEYNSCHAIHNDEKRDEFYDDMVEFILMNLPEKQK